MTAEQLLYRAVIARAIMDAYFVDNNTNGLRKSRIDVNRHEARNFLSGSTDSLALICEMAGIREDIVREKCRELEAAMAATRKGGATGRAALRAVMQWVRGDEGAVLRLDHGNQPLSRVLARQSPRPVGGDIDDDFFLLGTGRDARFSGAAA